MGRIRFCRGLPQTGERPLTEGERALLTAEVARAASRVRVYWALVACAPLLGIGGVVAAHLPSLPNSQRGNVAVIGIIASLIALPLVVIDLVRTRRRARELRRDLESPVVLTFGNEPLALVVLEKSLLVLSTPIRERVEVRLCALPPEDPVLSALPDEPRVSRPPGVMRRRLTEDEREEIADLVERMNLSRRKVLPWAAATVLVSAILANAVLTGMGRIRSPRFETWQIVSQVGFVLTVFGLRLWNARRDWLTLAKVRRDHDEGWALRGTEGPSAGSEGLPHSNADWTMRGQLAAWRTNRPVQETETEMN